MKSHISSSGYLRVLEKRLLRKDIMNKIADTSSTNEALKLIASNCDYDFSVITHDEDYEIVITNKLREVFLMAFENYDKEIIKIISIKHDINNLKIAIKSNFIGYENPEFSYITNVNPDTMLMLFDEDNEKPLELPEYILKGFKESMEVLEKTKDPQNVSVFLDKFMFNQMLVCAKIVNCKMITEYVKSSIDIYNIKSLARCKNLKKEFAFFNSLLAEGGNISIDVIRDYYNKNFEQIKNKLFYTYLGNYTKVGFESFESSNSLNQLEKQLDNYLIILTKQSKYIVFGPELIFSYIANKENEARQIRILLTGVMNKMSSDTLKERLRDNYA